jgi:hypothetical protein
MLGIRMLCPRYSISTALAHVGILAHINDFYSIPRLPPTLISFMMHTDFERSLREPDYLPVCFLDLTQSNSFSYKMVRNW